MACVIEVVDGGMATTVQDLGRPGYRSFGVALSGALDPVWLACANALVGNARDAAGLEIHVLGPRLAISSGSLRAALAGPVEGRVQRADGSAMALPPWQSVRLEDGDTLHVGPIRGGVAYLALSEGIDVPLQLGSRSTYVRAGIGGVEGRALRAGDRIGTATLREPSEAEWMNPAPYAHDSGPIRVMPGPQEEYFSATALHTLAAVEYSVTREADRMGMRLDGPSLSHDVAKDDEIHASRRAAPRDACAPSGGSEAKRAWGSFISDGVTPGAIQVPPNGQPILLLADCQTVGGYPKIATVIRADLPRLAHLLPGDRIRFSVVTRQEAVAALRAQAAKLDAWVAGIAPFRPAGCIDEEALNSANLISGVIFDSGILPGDNVQ